MRLGTAVALVGLLAPALLHMDARPAAAAHETDCRPYTTDDHFVSIDDAVVEAVVLAAELAAEIAEDLDAGAAQTITGAVKTAAEVARLAVQGINRVADACRHGGHWIVEDQLMTAAIQANLAVTTTADAAFVFPEGIAGFGKDNDIDGYIDREDDDLELAEIVGVKTTVRETIDKMIELGQCTCSSANSSYNQAVTELSAGRYKSAYRLFRQAYVYAFSN